MRKIKKAAAWILMGALCVVPTGCGDKKSAAQKALAYYQVTQEAVFDYSVQNVISRDNILYCQYENYTDNPDGSMEVTSGVIRFDMNTKESDSIEFENHTDTGYIENMRFDEEGNVEVVYNEYLLKDLKTGKIVDEKTGMQLMDADKYSVANVDESVNADGTENADTDTDEADKGSDESNISDEAEVTSDSPMALYTDDFWENYEYLSKKTIYLYSTDLELISTEEGELEADSDDEEAEEYALSELGDGEGNVIQLLSSMDTDQCRIAVKDENDKEIKEIKLDNVWGGNLYKMDSGMLVLAAWGDSGEELYQVDLDNEKLGKRLADGNKFYNLSGIYSGRNNALLIESDGFLYKCDCESGKINKVLKYMDCDLDPDSICYVAEVTDDVYCMVVVDYDEEMTEIDWLIQQPEGESVKKEEIRLATIYLDDEIKQKILKFNKTNSTYKIVIDEYYDMTNESEDAYDTALTRFNADMATGSSADIICVDSSNWKTLAAKGALEDWTPYLEKDDQIKKSDFVESVVKAYEVDGKLYALPKNFMIQAFSGATSKVGTETGWTIQEFSDYVQSLPDGVEIMDSVTSDGLLQMILSAGMDAYVDWTSGTCSFDSQEFITLLELCKQYQSSEELYENYEQEDWADEPLTAVKIREGKVVLDTLWLSDIDEYLSEKQIFGEPMTVKGFPTANGNGISISGNGSLLAISSKSKHKEVAWEFIKQFYTYDAQSKDAWTFPVKKDALDKQFKEAQNRELYTADDGTKYYTTYYLGDVELYIGRPTDEEIQELKAIIDSADMVQSYDNAIFSMVLEETESFFKGQKSAAEVAEVLQSRASIYVKENQ